MRAWPRPELDRGGSAGAQKWPRAGIDPPRADERSSSPQRWRPSVWNVQRVPGLRRRASIWRRIMTDARHRGAIRKWHLGRERSGPMTDGTTERDWYRATPLPHRLPGVVEARVRHGRPPLPREPLDRSPWEGSCGPSRPRGGGSSAVVVEILQPVLELVVALALRPRAESPSRSRRRCSVVTIDDRDNEEGLDRRRTSPARCSAPSAGRRRMNAA
jgi:hypothetical protein